MRDLDKAAMGKRIRQIRLAAGLRQWELARMLGTTQSAVHKYEHGVVPEPRRLVELARVGQTSIEWVLTGYHWENGSEAQERLTPEILRTACTLREVSEDEHAAVDEALAIIREAVRALSKEPAEGAPGYLSALTDSFQEHADETLKLLEQAWRIQQLVLKRVAEEAEKRMEKSPPFSGSRKPRRSGPDGTDAAA